ncbi:hypothetical protein K469DRAFT_704777 [Zopfia rhizophila CBS 207.26]|uniref:Uncharacterized protein n=1 Tax=Zopfia rhizophila CBS 207.26 TaxID=1314779 RepID=A0A6A6ECF8_9PEZI|nr:hypothetical protein K469DRAFT_704777 [Zopfia rhizophila CBS 207.26]
MTCVINSKSSQAVIGRVIVTNVFSNTNLNVDFGGWAEAMSEIYPFIFPRDTGAYYGAVYTFFMYAVFY